jgi:hypothetical protein
MATLLKNMPNQTPGIVQQEERIWAKSDALMLNAPLGWQTEWLTQPVTEMRATRLESRA